MRLTRVAKGYWDVLAVCEADWSCPVLDELRALLGGNKNEQALAKKMLALLEQRIAKQPMGPRLQNEQISRQLGDDVYELKRGQARGPKIRVTYFFGKGKSIVTVACFQKRDKTPQIEIARTADLRAQYRVDSSRNDIHIRPKEAIGYV